MMAVAKRAQPGRFAKYVPPLIALLVVILCAILVTVEKDAQPDAAPPPRPQPTWTTYVPQMPTECYVLVDRAVELYLRSLESDKATLDAARASTRQNYAAAAKSIRKAEKLLPGLTKSRDAIITQARKCEAK